MMERPMPNIEEEILYKYKKAKLPNMSKCTWNLRDLYTVGCKVRVSKNKQWA